MLLAVVAATVICPVSSPGPTTQPTPLQTIGHVTATLLCSGLRNEIGPSISGLRVNDRIISQGQVMMTKLRADALADPRSNSGTGGAGASSEMDDLQMSYLVQALTKNLTRIERLLNDPVVFPKRAESDDQRALDLAKARLAAVAAGQRKILNTLATTLQTNQANDLLSRCDPVDCPAGGIAPPRLSLPKALAAQIESEQQVENDVTPAVVALVQRCLRVR
jgi:hypothetical protein